MIAGCYSLDLYCDKAKSGEFGTSSDDAGHAFQEFPHQYTDELGSVCRSKARADGWIINLTEGTAICPKCSGKAKARRAV